MRIDYSKSCKDIRTEEIARLEQEETLYEQQVVESRRLLECEARRTCLLCNQRLLGERFLHRGIPFVLCQTCGHVQTAAIPPEDYPSVGFERVYPETSMDAYEDRKRRIYRPKLDWVISCFEKQGYSFEEVRALRWVEMGCGNGYFISCLGDLGIKDVVGFDADRELVLRAKGYTTGGQVKFYNGRLPKALELFPADVYVAFFVLEHVEDTHEFLLKLNELPRGTKFVFSVPVFGFSCVLESVFGKNYSRNLDCVYHTQLYTDNSIEYAMKIARFEIVAQWIFGQDVADLIRFIAKNLHDLGLENVMGSIMDSCVELQDSWQQGLDRLKLSDQRHIVAIKR